MSINIPNIFIPGQKAMAEEVNENFDTVKNAVNSNTTAIADLDTAKASKNGASTEVFNIADGTEETHAVSKKQLDAVNSVPTGSVFWFAAQNAPSGYLSCDGSEVSRTSYSSLFSVVGEVFGIGNGTTTFTLPDLRGEFVRGWDNSKGIDTNRTFGSSQEDEIESHNHNYIVTQGQGGVSTNPYAAFDPSSDNLEASFSTTSTGGIETRPRNVALLPCIKY